MKRWVINGNEMYDTVTCKVYVSRDKAYLEILNIIYEEIQELKGGNLK